MKRVSRMKTNHGKHSKHSWWRGILSQAWHIFMTCEHSMAMKADQPLMHTQHSNSRQKPTRQIRYEARDCGIVQLFNILCNFLIERKLTELSVPHSECCSPSMVGLLLRHLAGSKTISVHMSPAHLPVQLGYNDIYHSESYNFIKWQKQICS